MGVVLGAIIGADLWEVSWRSYLNQVLVVKREDLLRDALDTRVNQIKSVFARVDLLNDTVVHVDERLLSALDADKHAVQHFRLVHLVGRELDLGLGKFTGLVTNTNSFLDASVHHLDSN